MPKKVNCASFIFVKGSKFLVEKRAMTKAVDPGALEIPGGHFEKGETAEQALLREVKEELNVVPTTYKPLCKLVYKHPKETQLCHYFVITKWTGEIKNQEAESLQWLDFSETGKIDVAPDRNAVKIFIESKKHKDAILVFIFNEDFSKVLMLDRVKKFGFDWGFMVGKAEKGEKTHETANREVFEELGLKGLKFNKIKVVEYKTDNQKWSHHYFLAQIQKSTRIKFQKSEVHQIKWFSLDKLPKSRAPDNPKEILKIYWQKTKKV
ncbi:MAG: NUDIX hydrolase [Candidatus Diapherotrites archaeon]|nr:NUDIX hydrolase [Candidatus Diapherotrites archaeon]